MRALFSAWVTSACDGLDTECRDQERWPVGRKENMREGGDRAALVRPSI